MNRNARAHRLDEVVGEDGEQRLSDIIPSQEKQESKFEAPLHRIDAVRALAAYRTFGPVYGDALVRLPVRALLPIQRKRNSERQVRTAFSALLTRANIPERGHEAIQAARYALSLTGTDANAPLPQVRDALRCVQTALRNSRPVSPTGTLGTALTAALAGTALQPVSPDDVRIAQAVKSAFPTLPLRFPLAAVIGFGRKLDRQGKADRVFVAACRKAGVRIRIAEDALAMMKATPITRTAGKRIRVQSGKGYVRPMQLALEACAQRIGEHADRVGPTLMGLKLEAEQAEAQGLDAIGDTWLDALDFAAQTRARYERTVRVSETLNDAASMLEESCADLKLGRALLALIDADEALDDLNALFNHQEWWADAYWSLRTPARKTNH